MKRLRFIGTLWLLIHESDYLIDRKNAAKMGLFIDDCFFGVPGGCLGKFGS